MLWAEFRVESLTLFLAGGGLKGPLRFFLCHCQTPGDIEPKLGDFSQPFIAHILVKKNWLGQVRSGHQSRFHDPTSKKFEIMPELEFSTDQFDRSRFSLGYQYV